MRHKVMQVIVGSDHGGYELKSELLERLKTLYGDIHFKDVGVHANDRVDYPDYADMVVDQIQGKEGSLGILMCGTGIGISMRANRFRGIRAALVWDAFTAEMAKAHNNANILCLGGRSIDVDTAVHCVKVWLETEYEGGRHDQRLAKLDQMRMGEN